MATVADCWNGTDLDSPDHISHLASSGPGGCPSSHPEPIARLRMVVDLPAADPKRITLSSGGTALHADFWNTWDQAELEARVERCLVQARACAIAR